jgi:hypothetical protein
VLWEPSWWQILPRASGGTSAENEKCLRITAAMLRKSQNTKCPNYNFFYWGRLGSKETNSVFYFKCYFRNSYFHCLFSGFFLLP